MQGWCFSLPPPCWSRHCSTTCSIGSIGRTATTARDRDAGARPAPLRYPIPAARHEATVIIDRSRFLCTLAPSPSVEDAQALIRSCQQAHPEATHHCWAYLVGPPGSTDRIGHSDDGEPHGTAGRPMLTVLQHCGVGDIAAVVTRWFGGTKLGTGGLVKAYGGAVQAAMDTLPRTLRVTRITFVARISYAAVSGLYQCLPTFEAELLDEEFAVDVRMTLRCPEEQAQPFRAALRDLTRGQVTFEEMVP